MKTTENQNPDIDSLIVRYNALSNPEQTLLQLCSVIFEPTDIDSLWHCYRQLELMIQENKLKDKKELKNLLVPLQRQTLLNSDYTCNTAIIEEVSRQAVSARTPSLLKNHIAYLDSQTIRVNPSDSVSCESCEKTTPFTAIKTATGWMCASCALLKLKAFAEKENISTWPVDSIKESLLPDSSVGRRLLVLFRISDAIQLILKTSSQEAQELMRFVVRNLGYLGPHPLALVVRQAALNSCKAIGMPILPFLMEMFDTEPWQYYANIITVAGAIAPNDKQVRRLLEKAAKAPDEKIRSCAHAVLTGQTDEWTETLSLSAGADPSSDWESVLNDLYGKTGITFATDKYSLIARIVQETLPLPYTYKNDKAAFTCKRLMRDFRIGLYTHNEALLESCYQNLCTYCDFSDTSADPFVQVCNAPFNADWFDSLPVKIRLYTLTEIFLHTLSVMAPDEPALSYALDKNFQDTIPGRYKNDFFKFLVSRLLVGGRLTDARKLIAKIKSDKFTDGLSGWLYFIEGKNDLALNAFEADLNCLRKDSNSQQRFFSGISGLFHILALIKHQLIHHDPFSLDKAERFVSIALSRQHRIPFMITAYLCLKAIIETQQDRINDARHTLSDIRFADNCFSNLFIILADFWVNHRVDNKHIELFVETYFKSKSINLNWFAMESAELLCQIEQSTPVRKKFVKQIKAQTGMTPVSEYVPTDENWKKNLRALARLTASKASQPTDITTRLVWLVDYQNDGLIVEPREQKLTNKELWTRGRPVSLARLYHQSDLNFLTPQDRKICAAIEKINLADGTIDYTFNYHKLLPALAEHPLLFLMENPDSTVEVKMTEPRIFLNETRSGLNLSFFPSIPPKPVSVVKEGLTCFNVVALSEKQRHLASIIGEHGLEVPASARDDVLSVISGMSSIVTVHSSLDDKLQETEDVISDSTPYIHLAPSGNGFNLKLLVKPFAIGDPYLEPGKGVTNIITEINGKLFQTKRNLEMEEQKAAVIVDHCPSLQYAHGENNRWTVSTPEDCLNILLELKDLQEKNMVIVEWPEGEKIRLVRKIAPEDMHFSIKSKGDWFELSGHVKLEDNSLIDMKLLLEQLNQSQARFVPLKNGQFIALTRALKQKLEDIATIAQPRGKSLQLPPAAPLLFEDILSSIPDLDLDAKWTTQINKIKNLDSFNPEVPSTLNAKLRSYQLEGYQWLSRLSFLGYGACLADDMGLGKTLQALTVILERSGNGPSLVVAPTSVCMNWHNESLHFAPALTPVLFGGKERENIITQLKPGDVLIISYALMQMEAELLSRITWETIVLDEAQAIKNKATKRSKAALELNGRFKMITTGTPIENHLGELFTLFKFINPGLLGSHKKFTANFIQPIEKNNDAQALNRLKHIIRPFILRRIKSSVLHELPPRTDIFLQVEMSEKESAFYETLRLKALETLENDQPTPEGQRHLKVLSEITRLRRACCNPRLILKNGSIPSAKLELFETIISELLENRHKALVFSQFVDHLKIIRDVLDRQSISYCYLDGSTPNRERQKQVDAFQSGNYDLFLISLKAGGVGLNLTAADFVIHMDPWWNPAVEDQASDRAHRIGQKQPVTVYRLVMKNTIEEKIVNLHHEKRDLANSLLSGSDLSGKMSSDDLFNLIREA